jgi:hypothetical protein
MRPEIIQAQFRADAPAQMRSMMVPVPTAAQPANPVVIASTLRRVNPALLSIALS